jgi:hypothetical protein
MKEHMNFIFIFNLNFTITADGRMIITCKMVMMFCLNHVLVALKFKFFNLFISNIHSFKLHSNIKTFEEFHDHSLNINETMENIK